MPSPLSLLITVAFLLTALLSPFDQMDAAAAGPPQRGSEHPEKGRQLERVKRFIKMTQDDLNLYRQLAEEDTADLEKMIDDIPPLEPAQREADLLSLLDTYYSYLDWIKDRIEELEGDLDQLSPDNMPGGEFLENSLLDMVTALKELEKILDEKVKRFESERKSLVEVLEQRRLLQSRIDALEERLGRLRKNMDGKKQEPPTESEHVRKLNTEITVVRNELASLPRADEDMIGHYLVVIEMGRGEAEWISMQIAEYDMLRRFAPLLPRDASRFAADIEKGIRGVVRGYESETTLLKRRIDMLDKSRSGITQAGTLRETERLQELSEIYEKRGIRYNDLVNRLRVRIGTWEAEAAEIGSAVK